MPQVTRLVGIALILAVGAVHAYETPEHFEAAGYLGALFIANAAGSFVAAFGILLGAKGWGWTLGAGISALSALAYLWSRFFGLPGFEEGVGSWDVVLGSVAGILEILFLSVYVSVMTGMNVAAPDGREWHD